MRLGLFSYRRTLLFITLLLTGVAQAQQQVDIVGPPGSVAFGFKVVALPNGNVLVSDPSAMVNGLSFVGAVYLYRPDGTLVSTLVGSSAGDSIGAGIGQSRITVLANGNFVVPSPAWKNGSVSQAGAVTFGDANTGWGPGINVVGVGNSLVGSKTDDQVGYHGVTALPDGHFVVASAFWDNGATANVGAVTWGNGGTGLTGPVSTSNSFVGATAGDLIGGDGITALQGGRYVISSAAWNGARGAATLMAGSGPATGTVTASNSLVGTAAFDTVGSRVFKLSNGSFVVASSNWNGGRGAVTWVNPSSGQPTGAVSAANSLVGSLTTDTVGSDGVTALSNGNYVVGSSGWNGNRGAATWGNGTSGAIGTVDTNPSITGSAVDDYVGYYAAVPLSNGNYVVNSPYWNGNRGAITWGNGSTGTTGTVSAGNSLVGTTANDSIGSDVITLSNGNYVAVDFGWSNAGFNAVGSFTWGSGRGFTKGAVSTGNSVYGQLPNDYVGLGNGSVAYSNGAYAVHSSNWSGDNTIPQRGAVTLIRGNMPFPGTINTRNSVLGARLGGGQSMSFDYNPANDLLVVGRPGDTKVSLMRIDQLFRDDLEQR